MCTVKDRFCILFFDIVIVIVIMHISNVYLLVLSKATGQTLQKHYVYDRKNKVHAPSPNASVGP